MTTSTGTQGLMRGGNTHGGSIIDSYTGFTWCRNDLHLLTPENRTPNGRNCRRCAARQKRIGRKTKGWTR